MSALVPLDPAPSATRSPVELLALDARRSADGLEATVQASNGVVVAARLVRLADPADRRKFAEEAAPGAGATVQDVEGALLALLSGVEAALRKAKGGQKKGTAASQETTPTNISWDDEIRCHPALDFVEGKAYVCVPLKADTEVNGKHYSGFVPFCVTSDRELFQATPENLEKRGLYYAGQAQLPPYRWSRSSIKAYLEGKAQPWSPVRLFSAIGAQFNKHVEFRENWTAEFVAVWIIATYLFALFKAYPYVFFGGRKRSGKSTTLDLISKLAFNGQYTGNMSSSALFRSVEANRGTQLIDESEKLSNPERAEDFRTLLNSGYKAGGMVCRVDKDREGRLTLVHFDAYSPKAIANIKGIEDVLADRCIEFVMLTAKNKAITRREINDDDPIWGEIRDNLYLFMLHHWSAIQTTKGAFMLPQELESLSGREGELWRPVLVLAKYLSGQGVEVSDEHGQCHSLFQAMVALAKRKHEQRETEDLTGTGEGNLISALSELTKAKCEADYYSLDNIKKAAAAYFGDKTPDWFSNEWIGRAMKRLGFIDKVRHGTGVKYLVSASAVRDLMERLGWAPPSKPGQDDDDAPRDLPEGSEDVYDGDVPPDDELDQEQLF